MNRILRVRMGDSAELKRLRQNQGLDPGHPFGACCSFCYSPLLFLHILGGTRSPPFSPRPALLVSDFQKEDTSHRGCASTGAGPGVENSLLCAHRWGFIKLTAKPSSTCGVSLRRVSVKSTKELRRPCPAAVPLAHWTLAAAPEAVPWSSISGLRKKVTARPFWPPRTYRSRSCAIQAVLFSCPRWEQNPKPVGLFEEGRSTWRSILEACLHWPGKTSLGVCRWRPWRPKFQRLERE